MRVTVFSINAEKPIILTVIKGFRKIENRGELRFIREAVWNPFD